MKEIQDLQKYTMIQCSVDLLKNNKAKSKQGNICLQKQALRQHHKPRLSCPPPPQQHQNGSVLIQATATRRKMSQPFSVSVHSGFLQLCQAPGETPSDKHVPFALSQGKPSASHADL